MKKGFFNLVTLVMLSFFVVSCGGSGGGVLSGIQVQTTTQNNDVMMSLSANLNLGAMSFANISLPIIHPHGQTPIGQVELVSGLGGQNLVKISVNLSSLANVQSVQAVLPNGNLIPLIANNQTIAVNLGKGARLYLTVGSNVTAVGVAVPISALDSIGQSLPGLNFFPIAAFNNIIATAGIFTGAQPGQNGIAVVADLSQVIKLNQQPAPVPSMKAANIMALQAMEAQDDVELDYRSQVPSAAKENKLKSMLYRMHQKKIKLRVH